MAADRIGIGFIGAGGIAKQRHLPGLKKLDGIDFVAVANRRRETAEQVAKEWGFKSVLDDWRQVLERKDVDAVFITAPPYLHRDATIAALEAGKHVFCQARMARNYAEAKEMHDASRKTKLRTMLCPPPHAMAADYLMKRLLKQEKYVGKPLDLFVYQYQNAYADPGAPLHWRQDDDVSGFNTQFLGMFLEVIHRWLGFHRRVQAITKVHYPKRPRPGTNETAEVKIADSLAFVTEMENGALSSWHFSGVVQHPLPNRFEIFGSDGTLIVEMGAGEGATVRGAKKGEELKEIPIRDEERRRWAAEEDFIRSIRQGGEISPDFFEGLKYMEMTEAVYRSAAEGRAIDLPLDRVPAAAR
ncbi:MAG TPA: Gfo/Idh/MocA family oxidoreductase [Chloroflexota bacterium]|jgi:predicted dehydrogenase|nr:Gfo/Idh/MocA family oxidoreductase [Chloroflexota bacterium]